MAEETKRLLTKQTKKAKEKIIYKCYKKVVGTMLCLLGAYTLFVVTRINPDYETILAIALLVTTYLLIRKAAQLGE